MDSLSSDLVYVIYSFLYNVNDKLALRSSSLTFHKLIGIMPIKISYMNNKFPIHNYNIIQAILKLI